MNKYTDGKRTIYATERAYNLLYKPQGFKPSKEKQVKKDVGKAEKAD